MASAVAILKLKLQSTTNHQLMWSLYIRSCAAPCKKSCHHWQILLQNNHCCFI